MALKEFLRDALKADLGIDPVGGKMTIKGDVRTPQDTDVNILTSATGDKVDVHNGAGNPVDVCMKSMQSGGLKTEPFGHHLSSRLDNRAFQTVYAGTPVTDQGSNGTVYFPKIKPIELRIVTHGNADDLSGPLQDGAAPEFVGDFTEAHLLAPGESYSYNVVPQQPYFLRRIYYKIAPGVNVGIGDSIRAHAYRGTDESGIKIYDHTTYATAENIGAFVAGAEFPAIITNQITNGIDYAQGEELHWVLDFDSADPTHRAAFYTSVGGASPWRAVDRQQEEHIALVPATSIFKPPIITSPVEGATGVEVEGLEVISTKQAFAQNFSLDYNHGGTVFKVRRNSDQVIVYDNNKVAGLSDTVTPRLSGSTQYSVQAAHYNDIDVPVGRSSWVNFKTMMDIIINISAGASTGDLVELDIGESVNATGYDFHLGGISDEFPPAAFDSGELRFKSADSDDLLFKVQSVTGTAPNRTAKVYVELNALAVGFGIVWLTGAGVAAPNVSQIESMWQSASTGGNITVDGDYRVHSFTSSGTFTPDFSGNISALVVGGGAGGDNGVTSGVYGHGGGGGFINYSDAFAVTASAGLAVVVGAGGALGAINAQASNGVASSLGSLTASGGLKANNIGAGGDGGDSGKVINGVTTNYNGGTDSTWGGAGGAGAGSTSAGASDTIGSSGGAGYTSSISGTPFEYSKGGNGSGTTTSQNPLAPDANTGHGGPGAGTTGAKDGASGVVIVRYPLYNRTIHTDKFISI